MEHSQPTNRQDITPVVIRMNEAYQVVLLKSRTPCGLYDMVEELHIIDALAGTLHARYVQQIADAPNATVDYSDNVLSYLREFKVAMNSAHHDAIQGRRKEVVRKLREHEAFITSGIVSKRKSGLAGLLGRSEQVYQFPVNNQRNTPLLTAP